MSEEIKEEAEVSVKSLKIKNSLIEKLIDFLDIPLHGVEARARNGFLTILGKKLVALNQERQRIYGEYSEKDEEGKVKFKEEGKKYDITPENLEKAGKELQVLYDEYDIIDVLPSNEKSIVVASKLLLETKKEFSIVDGAAYDELCKAFEEIK